MFSCNSQNVIYEKKIIKINENYRRYSYLYLSNFIAQSNNISSDPWIIFLNQYFTDSEVAPVGFYLNVLQCKYYHIVATILFHFKKDVISTRLKNKQVSYMSGVDTIWFISLFIYKYYTSINLVIEFLNY